MSKVLRIGARVLASVATLVAGGVLVQRLGARKVDRMVDPHAEYWRLRGTERPEGALVFVALGDSAAQSVGVPDPAHGYVGLVADRLSATTGRPVAVVNLSVSGARAADVVETQLPQLDALRADGVEPDLVTVVIGGNDIVLPGWSLQRFADAMARIAAEIPIGSVIGETPSFGYGLHERRSRATTAVVRGVARDHGHAVAPLHSVTRDRWPLRIVGDSSSDFFHPNARGYGLWAEAVWRGVTASGQFRRFGTSPVA